MTRRAVTVEADGASRGNPGPASYGVVLTDSATGEVIAERGERIGIATNNVAEYRGLIAGLELARTHAPGAEVEVRMDSQLVVEQMNRTWKVKHPDMQALWEQATNLAPAGTRFTWIARAENAHADRLANEALDATQSSRPETSRGWGAPGGSPTNLLLVRHGVTDHTLGKLFSGGLGSSNPPLNETGREQARATGEWLAPLAGTFDALISSPVLRTHQTAEIIGELLGLEIEHEHGIAEMEFGSWDGLSFTEVHQQWPDALSAWLGDLDSAPHGGESFRTVEKRVLAGRDRILTDFAGKTVVAVSHVTPIKTLVANCVGAPLDAVYRMELAPASVTLISYFMGGPDGDLPMSNLRLFNARPTQIFG